MPYFLYVNPRSGGNKAGDLLTLGTDNLVTVQIPNGGERTRNVNVHIFDLSQSGKSSQKPGFKELGRYNPSEVVLVPCGGDGTVSWVLDELQNHRLDPSRYTFTIYPFGTGNDLSRAFGWGSGTRSVSLTDLTNLVVQWEGAQRVPLDIWGLKLETFSQGSFSFVVGPNKKGFGPNEQKRYKATQKPDGGWVSQRVMINYFSTGFTSRVGLGNEKNRTTSACGNLLVYAYESFKKYFFRRPLPLNHVLDSVHIMGKEGMGPLELVGQPKELLALNIDSFARGADPWGDSCRSAVVTDPEVTDIVKRESQLVGQGTLSLMTYTSVTNLGLEVGRSQVPGVNKLRIPGGGRKIYQDKGPVHLNFLDSQDIDVYYQIDGDFGVIHNPKRVTISQLYKIQFLKNGNN